MPSISRPQFRALFLDQRDVLFRLLLRLCGNAQDAEDLLQETFMTVWRKRDLFDGRGAPEGFLRTTAVRLFLNARQVRDRRPVSDSTESVGEERLSAGRDQTTPDQKAEQKDAMRFLIERIEEGLEMLSEDARRAFVLFRFEGFSVHEIADMTSSPVKTVETRLRRATLALAEHLRPYHNLLPAS